MQNLLSELVAAVNINAWGESLKAHDLVQTGTENIRHGLSVSAWTNVAIDIKYSNLNILSSPLSFLYNF